MGELKEKLTPEEEAILDNLNWGIGEIKNWSIDEKIEDADWLKKKTGKPTSNPTERPTNQD